MLIIHIMCYYLLAPEVIKGTKYDEKVDVYSFGVVMWEVLTRKMHSKVQASCRYS